MKLKTKPSLPSSSGNCLISSSVMPVVSQLNDGDRLYASILSGNSAWIASAKCLRFVQVRGLGLHPQDVGERRGGQRLGDGILDSALHLVIALGSLGSLAVPDDVDAHRPGPGPGGVEGRSVREGQPLARRSGSNCSPSLARNSITSATAWRIGHQVGLLLPSIQRPRLDTCRPVFRPRTRRPAGMPWRSASSTRITPAWSSHALAVGVFRRRRACTADDRARPRRPARGSFLKMARKPTL